MTLLQAMTTTIAVEASFQSSLARAFKTPILGDATQFLSGYGPIPAVVKFTDDATWGQVGGRRIPHSAKTLLSPGGEVGLDEIYVREENRYWSWGVTGFRQPSFGFTEFRGELFFVEQEAGLIQVRWVYTLYSNSLLFYPFHWLFGTIFWRGQMQKGIQAMKVFAESNAAFLYE